MLIRVAIPILLSLVFLCGCNDVRSDESRNFTFIKIDSITLEPLTTVNVNSMCVKYYKEGDREYLCWGNRPQNSIEIFDLQMGDHLKTVKFPREGPNSISRIVGGFSIISFDSIFISNSELGKIYMFDTAGSLKKIFNHTDTSYFSANNLLNLNSKIHSDIYSRKGKLIFPLRTSNFPTTPSDSMVNSLQVVKIYDKDQGKFYASGLHSDPEIYEPLSLFISTSNAMLDDRFYYQIATQSAIRYTDDFKTKLKIEASSKYKVPYVKMSDYPTDPREYVARDFSYRSLLADPFNNLLYRTVKLPVQDIEIADRDKEFESVYERMSIMILNKKLETLGEKLFNHSNYSWNECFVGVKGLYLLRSPYHPNYFEPRITYDIYQITSTDKEEL